MEAMCADNDYKHILLMLKKFTEDLQREALARIPEDQRAYFESQLELTKRCVGFNGERCIFALSQRGGQAHTMKKKTRCLFCDTSALPDKCKTERGRSQVRQAMGKMQPVAAKKAIEERIPDAYSAHYVDLLGDDEAPRELPQAVDVARDGAPNEAAPRRRRRTQIIDEDDVAGHDAAAAMRSARLKWRAALKKRKSLLSQPNDAARKNYDGRLKNIKKKTRARFQIKEDNRQLDNEGTGFPVAKRSRRAADLERWCISGSWAQCERCLVMQPRDMMPSTFDKEQSATIKPKQCWRCSAKRQHLVPTVAQAPKELQGLADDEVAALSLLDIDVGPEIRSLQSAGYRQHATMIRFSWKAKYVQKRIEELPAASSRKAMKAFNWLYENNDAYKAFVDEHEHFLEENPDPSPQTRKRWLRFIEQEAVECACWPHLFWKRELCFSVERLTDPRRAQRERGRSSTLEQRMNAAPRGDGNDRDGEDEDEVDPYAEPDEEGDDDAIDCVRHSVRKSFAAKALGPLLEYGANYEILHFVYDLVLWSEIGSKKNLGYDIPMRLMMAGHPMSPLYWHAAKNALTDMVKQCGYPKLFITQAPFEKSMPYHAFIDDQLAKLTRDRVHLPIPETLHMTHVMMETARGLVTGQNNRKTDTRGWKRQLFRDETGGRMALMARIEFQDGTRKAATQDYHGSGRPHIHFVVCAENPETLRLDKVASASLPGQDTDPDLRGYVEASQLDRSSATGWPINDAPSSWDATHEKTHLKHTQNDKDAGARCYLFDIMDATKCHQDVLQTDDDGALQSYLVKYPVKFSDSMSEEWLNDAHGGNSLAKTVLFKYKPYEPEMILQLFGARFRQWRCSSISGGKRDFRVPLPDDENVLDIIKAYEDCCWRSENMSLLEFLRRTNCKGDIVKWMKQKHKRAVNTEETEDDLGTFADAYKMFGEQLVAADMLSWRNDKHRGQWLVLNVPFKSLSDFAEAEVDAKVPKAYRYLAMALQCERPEARRMWCHETSIREAMRTEGHHRKFIDDIVKQLMADAELVRGYLSGRLMKTSGDCVEDSEREVKTLSIQRKYEDFINNGRKTVEGRINNGVAKTVRVGDILLLGATRVAVLEVNTFTTFEEMLDHHGVGCCVPDVRAMTRAIALYHSFRNYRAKEREYGVVSFVIEVEKQADNLSFEDLNVEQRMYVRALREAMEHAFAVRDAEDEAQAQHLITDHKPKVQVCFGPPGTGKTAATFLVIEEVLQRGGYVLFAVYTAQLASRMRQKYAKHPLKHLIRVDTCHASFGLDADFVETPVLTDYQLVVVDEVSQLNGEHMDCILRLRNFADDVPAMAVMGDKWQMAGYGDTRAWDTLLWRRSTRAVILHKPYRCLDPDYQKLLDAIRTAKPEGEVWKKMQRDFLRKQKAWRTEEPTVDDVRWVLKTHPDTTMLAISRGGAALLNDLALKALHPRKDPLTMLPGDIECNPASYGNDGKLKRLRDLVPTDLPIYVGLKLYMTRNIRKDVDYVNGMRCVVEAWDAVTRSLVVITATGKRVAVTPWSDVDMGGKVYYPLRLGYCSTIMKFQGAELAHVTVYLDRMHVPAAAYTAMSRVRFGAQCLIGGWVQPDHFTPAR